MYKVSKNIKIFSLALMVTGVLGLGFSFYSAPKTVEEAKAMFADSHSDGHHEDETHNSEEATIANVDSHGSSDVHQEEDAHSSHDEHLLHYLQNRPWSALYVAALFFMFLSLGTLAFYAIQRASQAGWSPLLFRVMSLHLNHLFVWMDPEVVAHDKIIQGKVGYLNAPFLIARAVFYIAGWNFYRYISRKYSLAQDNSSDISNHTKNFKWSAGFLAFFIVTESMMSWDWIMSVDPHWFSTLFGWYVFASMFVSGITTIALITIYLKSKGYLEKVNHNHIHDLGKFMFGVSVFWTYLWFSQFMLIWYANIPEEVTYFITRIEDYNLPFFGMIALNFIFPLLLLMNSDYKRVNWFIVMTGIIILIGHYIDVFNMIMPATVGDQWFFGIPELSGICFFGGLFIYVVFNSLSKAPLEPSGDPLIKESEKFVY